MNAIHWIGGLVGLAIAALLVRIIQAELSHRAIARRLDRLITLLEKRKED